jgi:hypothetical protein
MEPIILIIVVGCLLIGLNYYLNPRIDPSVISHYKETIPKCYTPEECKVMWEAAQIWITKSIAYKIQSATDTVITTYGNGRGHKIAAQAIKYPQGNGIYTIELTMEGFSNSSAKLKWATLQSFNDYVNQFHVKGTLPPVAFITERK